MSVFVNPLLPSYICKVNDSEASEHECALRFFVFLHPCIQRNLLLKKGVFIMTKTAEIRTNRGTDLVPLETRMLSQRKIQLNGDITQETVEDVFQALAFLVSVDEHKPIKVFVDSGGGSVDAGLVLLDMFRTCPAPVEMYCLGYAYSMAALLFAAGEHGRYLLPNSKVMLHEPLIGMNRGGSASDIASLSKDMQKTRKRLNAILANATGKSEAQIAKETSYDHYFTAEEAVEFGLADAVVTMKEYLEVSV